MQRAGWLITCVILLGVTAGASALGARAGVEAPDFVLKSVAGPNLRLSEHRGEVVLLAFWASWCGDCRAQLESLAGLHELYAEAGLRLLAVSLDPERRSAEQAAAGMRADFSVLHDARGEVGRLYDVDALPHVVLIDRDGVVRQTFHGYRRGRDEGYAEPVRALLRE